MVERFRNRGGCRQWNLPVQKDDGQLPAIDDDGLPNQGLQRRRKRLFRIGATSRFDMTQKAAGLLDWSSGELERGGIEPALDRGGLEPGSRHGQCHQKHSDRL